ncbi:hypothetical protein [Oharaeibacter diazotrophicus]|uniref:Uncharacterized protein n=1 Tax=Oharaeibacter diazotrophicus TaxID=1920512 RepID=A0A4R6RDY8_9HYPH|nr:hypothetical protein [Oharaeibacter diazotrophicus]TDP84285.1 hypothetical protein EDD54_2891 [Oharaeibacter diazotrophicus]BBE73322.1 hypothetical protein OHA_1_02932 [Pleomorphomonas sp. SM30]GLS75113.1 hypothetical protein GCM10007904_04480 [Oharaeibacter diazotrophicus]
MISASEALSSLERAVAGVRRDEDRLTAMLSSATAEAERLRAAQAEGYKALARLRLDEIAGAPALAALDAAERRALAALERRRGDLDAAARKRKAAADLLDERASTRADRARDRDRALAAVEDLVDDVRGRIAGDAGWRAADAAVTAAEATAAEAEAKARQAEADREEKRRPYEADPLFVYLWDRGYGTAAYRGGWLARWGDGKVARLVGYAEARPNYFMLNEIPLRLAEHAARCRAAVADVTAARAALERAALEAAGVVPLEREAERTDALLAEADAAVEAARADVAGLDEAARAAVDGDDPAIRTAVDELAAAIARDDLQTLWKKAMATPDPADERIVEQLRGIERDLVRVSAEIEETRKAALDLARRRGELERSRENFRSRGYDDPWGRVVNEGLIAGIVEGIVRGALSSRDFDDFFDGNWSRREPKGGGFGGGGRMPRGPWGGGSGGSSGGGGFRSGGGSGGGGFRTGGGF